MKTFKKVCFIFVAVFSIILVYILKKLLIRDSYNNIDDETLPLVIWWTPFTGLLNNVKTCVYGTCIFTENRSQVDSVQTKAILFYGSDFKIEDLPLPRKEWHWWGLLHEESPKNQPIFNHEPSLSLFNLTSTFKQNSNFPLTLQYMQDVETVTSSQYFVSTNHKNSLLKQGNLSPIIYIQSDCNPPSKRDDFVEELSKYIPVDSYGFCLNNKDLPLHLKGIDSMNHPELLKLIANYKFTLAIENSGCEDYITEKLWRPLGVGSVPIYWGSPSVEKWLPYNKSVVHIRDFDTPHSLVVHLLNVLSNDSLYESYLDHKLYKRVDNELLLETLRHRNWGINDDQENKGTFVEAFECYVCDQIIRFHNISKSGTMFADRSHYGCPFPETVLPHSSEGFWVEQWLKAEAEAHVLHQLIHTPPGVFSSDTFYENVISYLQGTDFFRKINQEEL